MTNALIPSSNGIPTNIPTNTPIPFAITKANALIFEAAGMVEEYSPITAQDLRNRPFHHEAAVEIFQEQVSKMTEGQPKKHAYAVVAFAWLAVERWQHAVEQWQVAVQLEESKQAA